MDAPWFNGPPDDDDPYGEHQDEPEPICRRCWGHGYFVDVIADGMGPELPCDDCGGTGRQLK